MEFKGKICPVVLIETYLTHRNRLGHNSDNDYIFPNVGAKFAKVLPSHNVTIQILKIPFTYDNYRKSLKKHLNCKTLQEMGVSPEDNSTHSFRLGGLSVLADGEVNPAFLQKSARHKR